MSQANILRIINDANDDSIYLADVDTYKLIYLNPTICKILGKASKNYKGQPCYKVLQGLDSPCPFCTNHLLSESSYYTWQHHNEVLGKSFILRDRLVRYHGKLVRMEIATDITGHENDNQKLQQLQAVDESLVLCIDTLKNSDDTELAMNSFLDHIGSFYQADCARIYEIDQNSEFITLTYQWIRQESHLSHSSSAFPLSTLHRWFELFHRDGYIRITSLEKELDHDSAEYQVLTSLGIKNLLAVPLINKSGIPIGVIGVDNPRVNTDAPRLLHSVSNFVVSGIDKRNMLNILDKLSYNDTLTGVYNRYRYLEKVRELQKNPPSTLGIIYLDIDGMKQANDTYGHSFGDALLVRTANLLTQTSSYDVYRVGGDEFVVFCPEISQENFQFLTERLRNSIKEEIDLSISIGTKWTQGATDAMEQIVDADKLMSLEKQSYYNSLRADKELHYSHMRESLLTELNSGIFTVFLQPQMNLKDKTIIGAEALIRKKGNDGELISPAMFIPFYENEGLIQPIDFFVLKTVCQSLSGWRKSGIQTFPISVNFSRITMMSENFVDDICTICRQYEVPYQMIDIEMTESISKMDLQVLSALVKKLRDIGFSVSLDDFGTRYSNLSILTAIDFDHIKIDKSLVDHIISNEKAHTIVDYTIHLGKALDQTCTIAEGIETNDQFSILKDLECDVGQGFYFSKPIPISEFYQRYLQPPMAAK